eukprot:5229749-Amphidinium_carterae.1
MRPDVPEGTKTTEETQRGSQDVRRHTGCSTSASKRLSASFGHLSSGHSVVLRECVELLMRIMRWENHPSCPPEGTCSRQSRARISRHT